jgi:hypothetical protein
MTRAEMASVKFRKQIAFAAALIALMGCEGKHEPADVGREMKLAPVVGEPRKLQPRLPVGRLEDFELSGPVATVELQQWDVQVIDGREVRDSHGAGGQKMAFDREGRLTRYQYESDGIWSRPAIYEYSDDGLLARTEQGNIGVLPPERFRYEYSWEARKLTLTAWNQGTNEVAWLEAQLFDDRGLAVGVTRAKGKDFGNVESKHEFSYDEAGRVTKDTQYGRSGGLQEPSRVSLYRYDRAGRLVERTERLADGAELLRYVYSFAEGAHLPTSGEYYLRSELAAVLRYEYSLDDRGNWTQKTEAERATSSEVYRPIRGYARQISYHTPVK